MDAVEFMNEYSRMCRSVSGKCSDCPMGKLKSERALYCRQYVDRHPTEAVAVVEKWSKENPKRTRLTDFLEKYPNAPMTGDKLPVICARNLGMSVEAPCFGRCAECWNTPLEEDKP